MSALQRAAAIAVALLVVVAVVVLGLGAAGAPVGLGPDRSASVEPTPSIEATPSLAPTADATPSALGEDEVLAALAEIEEQVIAIRGLPSAEIGPPDLITRAELAVELQRLFDEEYPPEDRERDNRALRALGLLGPDDDVAELQLRLLGDQVLGFYDDSEQRMVIVTESGLDPEAKLTYAHEYTHALQDAAFGLDSLETDAVGEDDRSLARVALIEGDATVTMLAWALAHLTPQELMQIGTQAEIPDTTGIPSWMVNQLQFPYLEGQAWVLELAGDPLAPDFTEVDAAYVDPPVSTAQIIDIDKWNARERPVVITAPDLAGALGDGWEEVDSTPIGQATARIILEHHGIAPPTARGAAQGWAGDRAVIAAGPDEAFAVAWRLAWETPEDASEFADAYRSIIGALPFPAVVMELPDGDVLVAHASTDDLLRQTVEAAD